jgi:phosphohistidine phosphatase SixA
LKHNTHLILKPFIAACFCLPVVFAMAESPETLSPPDLIKALQSGGHIIYMRHGKTDFTQKDTDRENFENCLHQRNLSKEGRTQAKQVGRAIHKLKIPIGNVLSSPYCRTKDTAKLVFGKFKIESNLQFSICKNKQDAKKLGSQLQAMMANSEQGKNNKVFVGHTANLKDGLGVWPKPAGAIAIFKNHQGKIIFKGMIKPNDWLTNTPVTTNKSE